MKCSARTKNGSGKPKQNDRDDYELRDEYDLSQMTVTPKGRYAPEHRVGASHVPHQIIRRIRTAHCKKGPSRCPKCREFSDGTICLLELWPPDDGMAQRRLIPVNEDGQRTWYAYEVARKFDTVAEARAFAEQNAVDDVEL